MRLMRWMVIIFSCFGCLHAESVFCSFELNSDLPWMIDGRTCFSLFSADDGYSADIPKHRGLVAGPYIGHTSTSSTCISWVTDTSDTGEIRYSQDQSYSFSETAAGFESDGKFWFEVELSGLQADTLYYYRVYINFTDVTPWPEVSFRTAPDPSANGFRFLVLGDGRPPDASSLPSFPAQNIADLLPFQAPDFALHAGDIVYAGGICSGVDSSWNQYIRAYLNLYDETLKSVPMYTCPGNHDLNDGPCGYQAYTEILQLPENGGPHHTEEFYSFDWGNSHFISLDNMQSFAPGSDQYDWLLGDLQTNTLPLVFVLLHYPAYSSGSHGSTLEIQLYLTPLFEQYRVAAVFCGHDHDYERTCPIQENTCTSIDQGGITYFVSGGAGAPIYPVGTSWFTAISTSTYHFLIIDVEGCLVTVNAMDLYGSVFDTSTLDICGLLTPSPTPGGPDIPVENSHGVLILMIMLSVLIFTSAGKH